MRSASVNLRRKVLSNRSFPIGKRLLMLQVYIFTKGTFQCSTWPNLSKTCMTRFHHCIMSLYRSLCGKQNVGVDQHMSDDDILYEFELMSPMTMLRVARLQLLCRIACKSPSWLVSFVTDCAFEMSTVGGWTHAVCQDLKWLSISPVFAHCVDYTFSRWISAIQESPKLFKRKVTLP